MTGDRARTHDLPYGLAPPGYRLPPATRVRAVRLQVADLERSIDYYTSVLGFRTFARSGRQAALGPHDSETTLVELHELEGASPAPERGRLGLYHFAILLPDRPALGRLIEQLARLDAHAGAADHLVSESIYLHDPDGLGIEVYADRPRSTWRAQGHELAMDTRPLDVASVVRAAGGEPWQGMPAGTTIGHIHLHVGDLRRAEAFYHEALGLDKVVWSYPGALFLSAGGYHHHLGVNTWAGREAHPPKADEARLLEWEIVVPEAKDVDAAAKSLQGKGHRVSRSGDGAVVADPWGTVLRLKSP